MVNAIGVAPHCVVSFPLRDSSTSTALLTALKSTELFYHSKRKMNDI